jgi:WD40 repeat protein
MPLSRDILLSCLILVFGTNQFVEAAPAKPWLPEGAVARFGSTRFQHTNNVAALAFSPDGKILATGGGAVVRLWQVESGREIRSLVGPGNDINAVAFSPDGRVIAAGSGGWSDKGTLHVWHVDTGKLACPASNCASAISSLTFSRDGKTLVTGCWDSTIQLRNATSGKPLREFKVRFNWIRSVEWSPDGKTLASCSYDGVYLWDPTTGEQVWRRHAGESSPTANAFSADWKLMAASKWSEPIEILETATGKLIRRYKGQPDVGYYSVALSPEGKLLAAGGDDPVVRVWDVDSGKELYQLDGHQDKVRSITFAPDGKLLATLSGGRVRLWNPATGREVFPADGHHGTVQALAVSPNGKTLASAGNRAALLWDLPAGKLVGFLQGGVQPIETLSWAPDGRSFAGWGWGNYLGWDAPTGKDVHRGVPAKDSPGRGILSPDLKILAVQGPFEFTIRERATGKQLSSFPHGSNKYSRTMGFFSHDGRQFALFETPFSSNSIDLRETKTGEQIANLAVDVGRPTCLTFSPDDSLLAIGDCVGRIALLSSTSERNTVMLHQHSGEVHAVAFTPNGRMLASGGHDGTVRLWEVSTGAERRCLVGHDGAVLSLTFSPDGKLLYSGSADASIIAWSLAGHPAPRRRELSDPALQRLWSDLGNKDAARSYQAIEVLAAEPGQSLPFLTRRLKSGGAAEAATAQLIRKLDSDQFGERENASEQLAKLLDAAEPILRRAEGGNLTAEQRRRVNDLLEQLDSESPSPQCLQARRAIEVVEAFGTPEARDLLRDLSEWSPRPWVKSELQSRSKRQRRPDR